MVGAALIALVFGAFVVALPFLTPSGARNPASLAPTLGATATLGSTVVPGGPPDCSGTGLWTTLIGDGPEPTIANRAQRAAVIIGTVDGIGPARWNTDSGERPEVAEATDWPRNGAIFRPVTIAIDRLAKGSISTTTLIIRHLGGTVGCDRFDVYGQTELEVGRQYALFLDFALDISGQRAPQFFDGDAWPVGDDGIIQSPLEGGFSVDSFVAAVRAVP